MANICNNHLSLPKDKAWEFIQTFCVQNECYFGGETQLTPLDVGVDNVFDIDADMFVIDGDKVLPLAEEDQLLDVWGTNGFDNLHLTLDGLQACFYFTTKYKGVSPAFIEAISNKLDCVIDYAYLETGNMLFNAGETVFDQVQNCFEWYDATPSLADISLVFYGDEDHLEHEIC